MLCLPTCARLLTSATLRTVATDEHVSVAEAAELRGVHPATIKRWIQNGKLPAKRVGNLMWLIRRDDLEAVA